MAFYAISSSMSAATAALLEHAMAGRAQAPDIGAQTSTHSLFIRYRISAQAEGIILASRLLLLCISGRGSRKANHGQCERKRDHLLHRGTPVRTETAARVDWEARGFNLLHCGAWPKWDVFPLEQLAIIASHPGARGGQ